MKRLLDVVLVIVLLGAAGVGAYEIGHRVDHLSNSNAAKDSELNVTTTTGSAAVHHGHTIDGRQITPLLVGIVVGAVLLAFIVAALLNGFVKSRRRQRWRTS